MLMCLVLMLGVENGGERKEKQDFMEVYIYITSFLSIVKVTV